MRKFFGHRFVVALVSLSAGLLLSGAHAQNRRLAASVDGSATVTLPGTVRPRARLAADQGRVPDDTPLTSVTLRFNMTAAQNQAAEQLFNDQLNPASPRFHQWLTPEQYGAQFGLSAGDLQTVTKWLQAQGLNVTSVARSSSFVTVSGTAAQVERAFGTTIHRVSLDGEQHMANLTDPVLPAPIAGVVTTITGLNDFHLKPHLRTQSVAAESVRPNFTSSLTGNHYIAPGDFYTIYDMNSLLTTNINGTGITIAVMGQTDISLSDVSAFRAASGLSTKLPTVQLVSTDPGTRNADISEAQLDVEWSGAVAPSANILYVNSTDVINNSLTVAIDQYLAPIITESYGNCEANWGNQNLAAISQLLRQGNMQGQTILSPAGDSGATDCDYQTSVAATGLAVDFPGSSPYATSLGGTMFNEGSGTYWNTSNNSNSGSALSYIPETSWNESFAGTGLASGGGGISSFFTKPSWQVTGLGNDFSRDVPDLSLNAASAHDGYLFCSQGSCTNGYRNSASVLDVVGGTSVSAPAFAGILALLEQKIGARVGNVNPVIYGLANSSYAPSVFHDIVTGNNNSPCTAGSTNCTIQNPNFNAATQSVGYSAGPGYDLATGWGTVDAFNLVNDWLLVTPAGVTSAIGQNPSSTSLVSASGTNITAGSTVSLTATVVSGVNNQATGPTGTVQLLIDNLAVGTAVALSNGSASLSYPVPNSCAQSGGHVYSVAYSGDTTYAGSKGAVTLNITAANCPDFTITPLNSTASAPSGGTATGVTLTITPTNGFTGPVTFGISTSSSTLAYTASFSATTVNVGTTPATTVLTLNAFQQNAQTTTGHSVQGTGTAANHPGGAAPWTRTESYAGSGVAMAGLLCLLVPRRRRRLTLLAVALVSAGLFTVTGCGTGNQVSAGPVIVKASPGTYTLTVSATGVNSFGQTETHNATVTLTVQ